MPSDAIDLVPYFRFVEDTFKSLEIEPSFQAHFTLLKRRTF